MFPVMLQLNREQCLVVGGGKVAHRKIRSLLAEGALVTVIAPSVIEAIMHLAESGDIDLQERPYVSGEAAGYALVFAATDERPVNRRVFQDARDAGVWVNVADDPELCSFHLPAVIRRGDLHVTLASSGSAPFAVRRLRRLFEKLITPDWGRWIDAAARFRNRVRTLSVSDRRREELFDGFFDRTIDRESFSVRVPIDEEELELLRPSAEKDRLTSGENGRTPGLVSLTGAGPGHPGLLTIAARRRLETADAVVYDRLSETALPCDLSPDIELHCVGKEAGVHPVPQDKINELLIRLSREGKRVVRLKGGDPCLFGRGGEEAEALARAGLPFEIIPGVTSGIAGPAWAGIPVSHRREAVRVTLITAHECAKEESQLRWDLLARDPASTLVAYMGMKNLPRMTEKLVEAGMDPETPAAVIERATTGAQRSVISTISRLPAVVAGAGLRPPALVVIGRVVGHAGYLDWRTRLPLAGRRILLSGRCRWADMLTDAGADIVEVPLPPTPASRIVVDAIPLSDVLLDSPGDAEAFAQLRGGVGWGPETRVWCVGDTARKLAGELGWSNLESLEEDGETDGIIRRLAAVSS